MFVLFGLNLQAQIINFPDANFKARLLNASSGLNIASTSTPSSYGNVANYVKIDTNNNGEIEVSEAAVITYLNVSLSNITDLTGIEYFTNLLSLISTSNQLVNLDLSQNHNIEYLICWNNQLTTLDLSQNPNLKYLICADNQLTSLNVSQNYNLMQLTCHTNQLISLDVSQKPNLVELSCNTNQLTILDVSQNTNLNKLYCYDNYLNTLDVSANPNLEYLNCSNNQLSSLFIKNNNPLWQVLIFNDNPNLQYLCADDEDFVLVQQKINNYGYTNIHVNSYCSFTPGEVFYILEGTNKWDLDSNGCDSNDINYPNLQFSITNGINSGSHISNNSGNYNIPIGTGIHTIIPMLENPTYFNISPANLTVDFPTQASPFTQDFCVTANGIRHDVEVVILPTVPARPGFDATYKIIYRNKGNQIENGAITFTYNDAVLDYVSANPVYDSQATDSFIWNYSNLLPFETREIEVVFNVNSPMETPAVNIGDQLNFTAQITPMVNDEVLYDNTSAIKQIVVGSYDPNDKTCLEGETVGPDMIGEYVHYLIRFENTGTYPAENVVVKDMIDLAKFDLATLIPLKGSHDFYTRIKDNKVEFIFENINLDFNDPTNDGYVAFKIKTKSDLVVGDTFSNDANIYFDYNFPITTNTYTTTIEALNTQDFDFGSQFTLYPNPVKEVLNFNSKENLNIQSVEIYNMLGQIVISVPNATTSIDISTLTKGNYFVKVNTEKGSANTKFVKE